MAVRPFLTYPDPRLRTRCAGVVRIDDEVRAIWDDMLETMYAMPGVGLAACQIGVMRRLAVVDCSETADRPIRMANPEIVWATYMTETRREGSPNIPGVWEEVTRPDTVRVRWLDEAGEAQERMFTDLWATSVQHQVDHLNGVVFLDRLRPVKRQMVLDRLAKARKRARKGG